VAGSFHRYEVGNGGVVAAAIKITLGTHHPTPAKQGLAAEWWVGGCRCWGVSFGSSDMAAQHLRSTPQAVARQGLGPGAGVHFSLLWMPLFVAQFLFGRWLGGQWGIWVWLGALPHGFPCHTGLLTHLAVVLLAPSEYLASHF